MHVGLTDWPATEAAVRWVHAELAERGHAIERFGLCLDRAMGLPTAQRAHARRETGPRLEPGDWAKVAKLPVQPHLGDHMIGTPAGLENARAALAAGITSIGNLGQFFAFEPPGGYDDAELTRATVDALRAMAATPGALVHSYLDDGPAVQFSHYGGYAGWAALELYVVEELLGARLAHSYGGLIPDPDDRAIVAFALDDLRDRDSIGTMVYGNTVDYTTDHAAQRARAAGVPDGRHRRAAAPPDRPRDQPGAADRGGADPVRARDPRGPADRPRGGARGAPPALALGAARTTGRTARRTTPAASATAS